MYKLVFPIVLGILLLIGYQQYNHYQQQSDHAMEHNNYEQEKLALDNARATKSPQPLDEFIQQYPDSAWLDTAIYYRDKFAIQQIIESRDTRKLQNFISNSPDSEWLATAQQHLQKIQREQENKQIQQRILNNQPTVKITGSIPALNQVPSEDPSVKTETVAPTKTTNKTNRNESAERVKRALSIYQKMNKPNVAKNETRKKQQQEEEKRLRACNNLKDQLKQFNNSRRTRWYELDNSGKRVYMRKEAVALKKKEIKNKINEHCPE